MMENHERLVPGPKQATGKEEERKRETDVFTLCAPELKNNSVRNLRFNGPKDKMNIIFKIP